jgi:hypothetical protein
MIPSRILSGSISPAMPSSVYSTHRKRLFYYRRNKNNNNNNNKTKKNSRNKMTGLPPSLTPSIGSSRIRCSFISPCPTSTPCARISYPIYEL